MSELGNFVIDEDDFDDNNLTCMRCSGEGYVHGCWDDLCRASDAMCCPNAKFCSDCGGNGWIEVSL